MPEVVIKVDNLSKKFRLGRHHSLDLRNSIGGLIRRILFKKIKPGEIQNSTGEIWALKDISFEIKEGEAVGIIGPNGAGKSTLLKILSRITFPTSGKFLINGRVSSLLEVGTGFHMELTGRENIFLNGTILGMKRREINQKFDEIVSFSGIERFIDTPVKRYSSGMLVRLAFSVAAHLEPEILVIDEVLAVGDAEFQKKCLGKMEDVAGQGRTVLFVSHNMPAIKSLCKLGILLKDGTIQQHGEIGHVIDYYLSLNQKGYKIIEGIKYLQPWLKVKSILINGSDSNNIRITDFEISVLIEVELLKDTSFELDVHIKKYDMIIASYSNFVKNKTFNFKTGTYSILYNIQLPDLKSDTYTLDLFFTEPFISWFAICENFINIDIINTQHNTFLNTPALKWGQVLLSGTCKLI